MSHKSTYSPAQEGIDAARAEVRAQKALEAAAPEMLEYLYWLVDVCDCTHRGNPECEACEKAIGLIEKTTGTEYERD